MASDLSITGQIQSETKFENLSRNLKILFKKLQALFKKKLQKLVSNGTAISVQDMHFFCKISNMDVMRMLLRRKRGFSPISPQFTVKILKFMA